MATNVERKSLTNGGLEGIYKAAPSIANVGGGSAKDAGTEKADVKNPGVQGIQKGFTIRQPVQSTQFTDTSLNYAEKLGADTRKYKG